MGRPDLWVDAAVESGAPAPAGNGTAGRTGRASSSAAEPGARFAGSPPDGEVASAVLDLNGVVTATNGVWKRFGGPDKPDPAAVLDAAPDALVAEQLRPQARERLEVSETLFRSLFEWSAVPTLLLDLDGGRGFPIMQANAACCALLRARGDDLVGAPAAILTRPQDQDRAVAAVRQLRSGEADRLLLVSRYRRHDGSLFWASPSCARRCRT